MTIENIRFTKSNGEPVLKLDVDGRPVAIYTDLKRTLLDEGVVFLGAEYEQVYTVDLAADASIGRPATRLQGFTDDADLIELVRIWLDTVEG